MELKQILPVLVAMKWPSTSPVFLVLSNPDVEELFLTTGKRLSVHHLNNRVFLSRNYRLIVAPRKFDVLKTNICPRSDAS